MVNINRLSFQATEFQISKLQKRIRIPSEEDTTRFDHSPEGAATATRQQEVSNKVCERESENDFLRKCFMVKFGVNGAGQNKCVAIISPSLSHSLVD